MLDKLKRIFYRPDFFRQQTFTGSQAFTFYSLSILALVVGFSLLIIPALFGVNRFFDSSLWREQKAVIENLYPDNLVLTLNEGRLTTNQAEPVVIPFPEQWRDGQGCRRDKGCRAEDWPTNLLVIDKGVPLSRQAFTERDTLILAGETEIGFHNVNRGETRIFSLTEAQFDRKLELTNATFDSWVGRIAPLAKTATLLLMCVLPLLMYGGLWVGYLVYSLLGALVVWLAAHIRGHKLTYGRAYLSTLYLLPAPFLANLLLSGGNRIPLLFTLILFGMAIFNFGKKNEVSVESTLEQQPTSAPSTPAPPEVTMLNN